LEEGSITKEYGRILLRGQIQRVNPAVCVDDGEKQTVQEVKAECNHRKIRRLLWEEGGKSKSSVLQKGSRLKKLEE